MPIRKLLDIKFIGNHVGAVIASCHHTHHIKQLQTENDDR